MTDDDRFEALLARALAAKPGSPEERVSIEEIDQATQHMPEVEPPPGWEDRAVARWQRRRWLIRLAVGALVAAFVAACAIAYLAI